MQHKNEFVKKPRATGAGCKGRLIGLTKCNVGIAETDEGGLKFIYIASLSNLMIPLRKLDQHGSLGHTKGKDSLLIKQQSSLGAIEINTVEIKSASCDGITRPARAARRMKYS